MVASRILLRASEGEANYDDFMDAGNRAILDQLADAEAARALFR